MFDSFYFAGFEGTTGFNKHGEWIDQVAATQHDRFVDDDYRMLRRLGIYAARDAVRWPLIDIKGRYDFSIIDPLVEAARNHRIEIIYDLFHFGYPLDADPFSDNFAERFAEYCYAAARYIVPRTEGTCYFTPVNEPSYFSWAAGEVGLFAPYEHGRGWELKVRLIRAAILGIDAIRSVSARARFVNVDPICRVVPPAGTSDLDGQAEDFNRNVVYQGWDLLSGRIMPEIGGSPGHLDIVGVNYYWTNQWEIGRPGTPLQPRDPRIYSVGRLLGEVALRYPTSILITETSHVDGMRPAWVRETMAEAEMVLDQGWPLKGICIYPITSMPEWHARDQWTSLGLWDLVGQDGRLTRICYEPMVDALREAQQRLDGMQYMDSMIAS